jgi:hypothetical protein
MVQNARGAGNTREGESIGETNEKWKVESKRTTKAFLSTLHLALFTQNSSLRTPTNSKLKRLEAQFGWYFSCQRITLEAQVRPAPKLTSNKSCPSVTRPESSASRKAIPTLAVEVFP